MPPIGLKAEMDFKMLLLLPSLFLKARLFGDRSGEEFYANDLEGNTGQGGISLRPQNP